MIRNQSAKALASGLILLLTASQAGAQGFGDFLNALKNIQLPTQQSAPAALAPSKTPTPAQPASYQPGLGAKMTENYCRNLYSVAAMEARGPIDENLISEEFSMEPADFYDEAIKAFDARPGYSNYAFPSPNFYQHEFETDKINVIYDLILSYPSAKYVAALITEARMTPGKPRYDNQAKVDAVAALAMLHYRMQPKSRNPNRWAELAASLQNEEHYLAKVITARLFKSGELGTTDISKAITLAREANNSRTEYQRERGMREWSPRNYQITSNLTLFEVVDAHPTNPQSRYFTQFVQNYKRIQGMNEPLPEVKAQLAPTLAEIERASRTAAEKATQMLASANKSGNIKAQKASLDSATRTRVSDASDFNVDQRTMAALSRELEKMDQLNETQTQLLDQSLRYSHESGDRAIMMMPLMMNAIFSTMSKGMEYLPTLMPYSKKLQAYSDSACSVISRIDHTVMVKKLTAVAPERNGLANLMAQ